MGPRTHSFTEQTAQRGPWLRIDYPVGERNYGQVIIESPRESRHYLPEARQIRVGPPRIELRLEKIVFLANRGEVRFTVAEGETLAGSATKKVTINHVDGRLFQTLWISPSNGFIFKREFGGGRGRPKAVFTYQKVDFDAQLSPSDFEIDDAKAEIVRPEDELQKAFRQGFAAVRLERIPFRLESAHVMTFGRSKALVQTYAGMEGRLSLFQVLDDLDEKRMQRFTKDWGAVVAWKQGGKSFALLGDMPEARLRQLASNRTP